MIKNRKLNVKLLRKVADYVSKNPSKWVCAALTKADRKAASHMEKIVCQLYLEDRPPREQVMPTEGQMESQAAKWLGVEFKNDDFGTEEMMLFYDFDFPPEYRYRFAKCAASEGRVAIWREWVEEFIAEKEGKINDPRCTRCRYRLSSHGKRDAFEVSQENHELCSKFQDEEDLKRNRESRGLPQGGHSSPKDVAQNRNAFMNTTPMPSAEIDVALLTGGLDRHYAFGLAMALVSKGVCLDVIGSDEVDSPELHSAPGLTFLNLRRNQQANAGIAKKVSRVLGYYTLLFLYTLRAKPKIFHILWNNKFEYFDRTVWMLYYKLFGKKIAFTAHNVNAGTRDSTDSPLNRLTLRIQYKLADHIFVHTEMMKSQLLKEFGVSADAVSVIPYGVNNAVPETDITSAEAKRRLGIENGNKTILFFGTIRPYKGLEYLLAAFRQLAATEVNYRLIIAGEGKKESREYLDEIQKAIHSDVHRNRIIEKIQFIPDEEMELYFKAADVLVLPYKEIFQSGVLYLGYSFGLPVIASDVGSLKEGIIEGKTGFLCRPGDAMGLAKSIQTYFDSDLYRDLPRRRKEIRNHANTMNSWDIVGNTTRNVYSALAKR